jgi:hypothetical protein
MLSIYCVVRNMASPETSPYIYLAPYLVLPFDVKDLSAACTEAYRKVHRPQHTLQRSIHRQTCMASFLSPQTVGASSFSIASRSIHAHACRVTERIVHRPMLMGTCLAKSHVSRDVTRPDSCYLVSHMCPQT